MKHPYPEISNIQVLSGNQKISRLVQHLGSKPEARVILEFRYHSCFGLLPETDIKKETFMANPLVLGVSKSI